MKALEDKIRAEGKILPGPVLKVSSFLNHQMDSDFIMELGRALAERFREDGATKILTIESSVIAIAVAAGAALHVPVLFAKKHRTSNVSGILYQTLVHSYTHGTDYTVVVEREYLKADDRVLIIDDFLANGKAVEGLLDLASQAGAAVVGAGIVIEKGFQEGGERFRRLGVPYKALAVIDRVEGSELIFRDED